VRNAPPLASLLLLGLIAGAASGCRAKDPAIKEPFIDTFDRAELGATWNATSPEYHTADGRLVVSRAFNHPAWLRKKLPRDVVIELDATAKADVGDLKIEIFGDGESFDPDKGAYTSTGYGLIFGGWNNSLSVIARMNEHDEGRKAERNDIRVRRGRTYHWTVTRRGGTIDWKIDGQPFLQWTDPEPLAGPGHEYLAVNNWESEVTFDNLAIKPAP
jgi:hypothetical protein